MPLIETAIFPSAIATATDMLNWKNVVPSGSAPTLNAAINNSVTTIVLTAGTGASLPADNFVVSIDDEIIFVSSRSTDTLTCTRGYEGTTGASHLISAPVYQRVTAKSHNQIASEINAIETQLGVNLSAVKAAFQNQSYSYVVDSGAADAYVATLSPAVTAYVTGQRFCFKALNANLTTTPTLNVNGLGAKTITKNAGAALAASDIKAGQVVDVEYDGTNFQIQSTLGNAPSGSGTVTHTAGALTSGQLVFGNGTADITVGNLSGDVTTSGSGATLVKQAHWTQAAVTTTPYAILSTDSSLNCNATSAAITLNLPAATGSGKEYFFVKTDSTVNSCTISRNGSDTIEGTASVVLASQYDSLLIRDASSGSWMKVSPKVPGSIGNLIYNNNGNNFGALRGTSGDSSVDITTASSFRLQISDSWAQTVSNTNVMHAIDTNITLTGAGKTNTFSGYYGTMIYNGTGGCGHCINVVSRIQNHGRSAGVIDELDGYYQDMTNDSSDNTTVTQSTAYNALQSTFAGTTSNVYSNHAGFRYSRSTWTTPTVGTVEQGFVTDMPVLDSAQLGAYYGLRIGGATKSGKYVAMAVGGGESYFTEAIEQSANFSNASNTNLTTGGVLNSSIYSMFRQSNFVNQAVVCANIDSLITITNGSGAATAYAVNGVADNGGTSAATLVVGGRFQGKNSGSVTLTKSIGVAVVAPSNGGTITDTSGIEIASLTAATQTNTPQAIKQVGAADINTYAGISFLNGNKAFVTSDFQTSGSGTALEAITGLTFTLPTNTAQNVPFNCSFIYHQNVATAAIGFGIKASVAPTQINASGQMSTSATAATTGNLVALTTTTATAIVSATPTAITTNWNVYLAGLIENPSGAANTITFLTSTATAADLVVVKRGSYCTLGV